MLMNPYFLLIVSLKRGEFLRPSLDWFRQGWNRMGLNMTTL